MKVKLTCSRVGHTFDDQGRLDGEFAQSGGEIVEMDDVEAARYLKKGLAVRVSDKDKDK